MLKNFINLDPIEAEMVRNWRNHERVRRQMFTHHEISLEEHAAFLASLSQSETHYYLVYEGTQPCGVIVLTPQKQAVEIGIYSNPALYGKGAVLLEHVKKQARLLWDGKVLHASPLVLRAYVLPTNAQAIACYERFGFVMVKSISKSLLMEYADDL